METSSLPGVLSTPELQAFATGFPILMLHLAVTFGLLAAGAGMQFGLLTRGWILSASVLSIRHLVQPLLAFAMARLFGLNAVQTTMLLAFSALPTASTCYVLAARMGYNGPYVAGLVTLSTVLGVASLPFALSLVP